MIRATLMVVAVLGAVVLVIVATGFMLPVAHVASRTASFSQPADRVYVLLIDVQSYPQWRSDVKSVEDLSASPRRWREHGSNGDLTFEVVEANPPGRLVTRIADPDLPFGGSWTYELAGDTTGTRLSIIERGEVYNPVFRFMSRFVFGHTATMDQFLADLKKRLG